MNNIFTIEKDGKPIPYTLLMTFYNEALNEHFAVYTDKSEDENGNLNILVSSYDPAQSNPDLLPLRTEAEWEVVNQALEDYNEQLMAAIEAQAEAEDVMEIAEDEAERFFRQDGKDYQILAAFETEDGEDEYLIYIDKDAKPDENGLEVQIGKALKGADGTIVKAEPVETVEEWEMIKEPVENLLARLNER